MSTPIDVARALHARGETFEAEVIVLGALARDPSDTDARSAAMALRRGHRLGAPTTEPTIDLKLIDGWIRRGMLVEALALLVARPVDGDEGRAAEWAELLGELLAPVPAHAEPVFVEMHRQLLRGAATVALAVLEDRRAEGPLPAWAERRLSLLRWMLLDNAQAAVEEERTLARSALAQALEPALAQRSLMAAKEAAAAFAETHPDDAEAAEVHAALGALIDEMSSHENLDPMGGQTVPVMGRPAAAMQLQMASLQGAASLYRRMATGQVAPPEAKALLYSVETVLRALAPRAGAERRFARPVADGFDDVTKPRRAHARALAASPVAKGGRTGTFEDDEGPTRVAGEGELPLEAFEDEATRDTRSGTFEDDEAPTRVAIPGELPLDAFADSATRNVDLPSDLTEGYVDEGEDDAAGVSSCGTFKDTDRSGMAEAVEAVRRERDFDDGPTEISTAPLSGELTMVDVDVDVEVSRPEPEGGAVIVARVIKVGGS